MKEIGKLLELLNEYEKESNLKSEIFGEKSEFIVISKQFGFIKWLVENDKIDRDILEGKRPYYYLDNLLDMHGDKVFSRCERLLMLLAIQDEPIRFLCEILK